MNLDQSKFFVSEFKLFLISNFTTSLGFNLKFKNANLRLIKKKINKLIFKDDVSGYEYNVCFFSDNILNITYSKKPNIGTKKMLCIDVQKHYNDSPSVYECIKNLHGKRKKQTYRRIKEKIFQGFKVEILGNKICFKERFKC